MWSQVHELWVNRCQHVHLPNADGDSVVHAQVVGARIATRYGQQGTIPPALRGVMVCNIFMQHRPLHDLRVWLQMMQPTVRSVQRLCFLSSASTSGDGSLLAFPRGGVGELVVLSLFSLLGGVNHIISDGCRDDCYDFFLHYQLKVETNLSTITQLWQYMRKAELI